MRILLLNNRNKQHTVDMAEKVAKRLKAMAVDVEIDNSHSHQRSANGTFDLIIVLGGDGTMLRAARAYGNTGIPFLGVNMGTVGFLSNIQARQLDDELERLIKGEYYLEERMIMEATIYQEGKPLQKIQGLNEVVFRSGSPRMVEFLLNVEGQRLGIYRGDGVIIATPTGSTAYSLSAGGPIVDPALQAFIVTPIASHIVHRRSMVVSAHRSISISPIDARESVICVDGQVLVAFHKDYSVTIERLSIPLRTVNLTGANFYDNLENRLRRNEVQ